MGDSSSSYIHLVQHLIEKCLIFNMTKEECMETLSKHANIKPVITSTEGIALVSYAKEKGGGSIWNPCLPVFQHKIFLALFCLIAYVAGSGFRMLTLL
ncbi:uncharacterized protein LOC110425200 isoform X1 [Herrania umbratica]|uniref:Uncharacterized protein LOC110425200 isoform X1 n=1 Tax=Herrania umbratica TaxID=108875 RepID=A0A6J1B8F1_9ROSI|nr:uncharacterized protein LOC110425200 isoform X1 [Herrania umbratica]